MRHLFGTSGTVSRYALPVRGGGQDSWSVSTCSGHSGDNSSQLGRVPTETYRYGFPAAREQDLRATGVCLSRPNGPSPSHGVTAAPTTHPRGTIELDMASSAISCHYLRVLCREAPC